ncbi:MAG: polysaccharide biosynthesis/export family protein [Bryobacteraceae bacterium]
MKRWLTGFLAALSLFITFTCAAHAQNTFAERDPAYRLQAGDTVDVQFRYTPEYNGTLTVQPDGVVNLQVVGRVKVGGLTLREAEKAIAEQGSKRLNQPEVSVLLKDFVRPYFVVAGEVAHPGRFEMHGSVTALEAIAVSGGFKESSKHSQVILVRKFNSEYAQVSVLNMKAIMTPQRIRENPELQPGDMLVVPQNVSSKLERYIRWTSIGLYGAALIAQ